MKRVIVIGGGAIGLCTAHELAAAGHEVSVLEKGEIGSGSSMHNAGLVCPSHFVPLAAPGMVRTGLRWMFKPDSPFYIKPRLDPSMGRWLWHFARSCTARHVERSAPLLRDLSNASLSLYEQMAHTEGMDFGFRQQGLLMLFRTRHGEDDALAAAALADELGVEARVVDRHGLMDLNPGVEFRASGGVYYARDAHLTPALLMESLHRNLSARGVRLLTSTTVTGFRMNGTGIASVETDTGAMAADEFVLAGGAWSPGIVRTLHLDLPIQAGKGYSVTVRTPPVALTVPCILDEARVAVTPMGSQLRFAGTMELAGLSTSLSMRRVQAIVRALPDYFGGMGQVTAETAELWEGLRPVSPDGLPYIGRFRQFRNLIAATGHAMLGISLAPVTGRLVAEIVNETPPSIDCTQLGPERFS
jgi:D-amino-acid dehydrogenase